MLAQQEVAFKRNRMLAGPEEANQGQEFDVLIDRAMKSSGKATAGVGKGGALYAGRTRFQAPDIDSITFVQSAKKLTPGELVRCRMVDVNGYDLVARPVEDLEKKVGLPILKMAHKH